MSKKINTIFEVMENTKTIKTLNRRHTIALKKFLKKIDETIYYATEEHNYNKFKDFQKLKERAIVFSNDIGGEYIESNHEREWIMMLPNFMIFSVIGFLTGLNTKDNKYTDLVEDLYDFHQDMLDEFHDIC